QYYSHILCPVSSLLHLFSIPTRPAPRSPLFPYTTLFRSRGWVYAISSTGKYLAPLPPGTYPSGNQYLWGTDLQGRDIFSQRYWLDRKSTRLNSSHGSISYAVFCLKKKKSKQETNEWPARA